MKHADRLSEKSDIAASMQAWYVNHAVGVLKPCFFLCIAGTTGVIIS